MIEGLDDCYTYRKNTVKVEDPQKRPINSLRLILSFSIKEKPVKNIIRQFLRQSKCFTVDFTLQEEHLGYVFCDIIAETEDGSFIFATHKKIKVLEQFPKLSCSVTPKIDLPKEFLIGVIPIEVVVETGKGITELDLNKIHFKLHSKQQTFHPKVLFIREKENQNRTIHFLLYEKSFNCKQAEIKDHSNYWKNICNNKHCDL